MQDNGSSGLEWTQLTRGYAKRLEILLILVYFCPSWVVLLAGFIYCSRESFLAMKIVALAKEA